MQLDTDRIDEAVLALLYLGLHDGDRAWKSFDWDAMGRLHEKGLISDPVGKAKSVEFTAEGLRPNARFAACSGRRPGEYGVDAYPGAFESSADEDAVSIYRRNAA